MDVLEHHDDRSLARQRLEEAAHGPEHLTGRGSAVRRFREMSHALRNQRRLVVPLQQGENRRAGPLWSGLPDDLGERKERRAVPVRHAATHEGQLTGARRELPSEPALPDAGFAEHGHNAAPALRLHACECGLEPSQLVVSADEGGLAERPDGLSDAADPEHRSSAQGAAQVDGIDRLAFDRMVHQPVCRLTDEDLARNRGLLESRRDVDRGPGGEGLAGIREHERAPPPY